MPTQPESGKRLPDPGFARDEGAADPALLAALAAYGDGSGDDGSVLAALAPSRLIIPVTAVPAGSQPARDRVEPQPARDRAGPAHASGVEMALPVMIGTDGRRALPAFTSLTALAAWDPASRPVPVSTQRAALGALQEDCAFLVIDPAGPVTWVADRAQVEALAAGP